MKKKMPAMVKTPNKKRRGRRKEREGRRENIPGDKSILIIFIKSIIKTEQERT